MSSYEVHFLPIDEIVPYDKNPRNNDAAVDAVVASIVQFGFRVPLLVDKDNVLVAGHTRLRAVKTIIERDPSRAEDLGRLPCFRADDLTDEQVRAFRLVDNKTAELAEWNFDLLAGEVALLGEVGINLTEFGWTQEEVDCLKSVVAEDCLNPASWDRSEKRDGVDAAFHTERKIGDAADGASVRVTVGTFGFLVLRDEYDAWFDGLMKDNGYDFERANDAIAKMLGLKEAKDNRVLFLAKANGQEVPAAVLTPAATKATEEAALTER